MNTALKEIFTRMKPVCDVMMVNPSKENVAGYISIVNELGDEHIQELQQYLLYPLITHIRSRELKGKHEQQKNIVDAMTVVLEKVHINNMEMCIKILTGSMPLIFDKTRPGMIADVPEELKLSAMKCLTALMLGIDYSLRIKLFKKQVPLLAQIIFVSVHMAKLEKLRSLRLAAIKNMTAFTAIHDKLTDSAYQIKDSNIEFVVVDMLSSILPGVLSALQDIAMDTQNPGHAVVVSALNTSHRVICVTMNDKLLPKRTSVTAKDFAVMIAEKTSCIDKDVSKGLKDIVRRSPEWYTMAGEKLSLVVRSLVPLSTHEHVKVRKELAVLCSRILNECNQSMKPSIPIVLDVLLSLSNDSYPQVAQYCSRILKTYFTDSPKEQIVDTLDTLCENFLNVLTNLPRVLNNINSSRKLVGLDLVYGYMRVLGYGRGDRLTSALTSRGGLPTLCDALRHAVALHTQRVSLATRVSTDTDVTELSSSSTSPWLEFRHLEEAECVSRLRALCGELAGAECAHLVLDHLLDLFQQRDCELAYIINCIGSAPKASPSLAKRILDVYLEDDLWYLPLELDAEEPALSTEDTLDVNVYNPRGWSKDSVPGLFEGAMEVRYTGISYRQARGARGAWGARGALGVGCGGCRSAAQLQRHLLLSCLLTAGLGELAARLQEHFQPYLMKTICLLLERVGSRYEVLHAAGLQATLAVASACGHSAAGDLIAANGDYITSQITNKLKKAWNIQSALEILSVVMRYSDTSILDYLYGIVDDVLVQSCDKYHEKDLYAYLQVFLTFINYLRKWFHIEEETTIAKDTEIPNVLKDVVEFAKNQKEVEEMLHKEDIDKKSAEEMYLEDVNKDENELDYDDTVTKEKDPVPRHISVTVSILRRTINFITSPRRDESVVALRVLRCGMLLLQDHEDHLLPLVHAAWSPLVATVAHPPVAMAALDLLVTMATLSKDFIRSRASKDVLPHIYKYLKKSSTESLLKDVGSLYRLSAGYRLQGAALAALPRLLLQLGVDEPGIEAAMDAALPYLSKNQPLPLQELSVSFFQQMSLNNYGVVWYYMRAVCANERVLPAPRDVTLPLCDVTGNTYKCAHTDYEKNIKLIFKKHKS